MALKLILKTLDGLDEAVKKLYVKQGEEFRLDVEGVVSEAQHTELKTKLEEFRENNRTLNGELTKTKETLKQYEGVDLEEVKRLRDQEQKLKDKKLIEAGKIDELLESKLQPIKTSFEQQLKAATDKNAELTGQLERMAIDDQLTKLGVEKGILPTAIEDFRYRGRQIFKLKDGQVVPLAGDGTVVRNTKGDPLSMADWIEKLATDAPHLFAPSKGGGAPNGGGRPAPNGATIPAGDPVAFGANLEKIAKGEVTVALGG